jgi:hypothetical protein
MNTIEVSVFMYENRTLKPVRIVLKREEVGGEIRGKLNLIKI